MGVVTFCLWIVIIAGVLSIEGCLGPSESSSSSSLDDFIWVSTGIFRTSSFMIASSSGGIISSKYLSMRRKLRTIFTKLTSRVMLMRPMAKNRSVKSPLPQRALPLQRIVWQSSRETDWSSATSSFDPLTFSALPSHFDGFL